jgi:hypothetical protein
LIPSPFQPAASSPARRPAIRVHELATETGRESREVLAVAHQLGEYVKSASSTLTPQVAARIRAALVSSPPRPGRRPAAGLDRPRLNRRRFLEDVAVSEAFRDDPDAVLLARKLGLGSVPEQKAPVREVTGTARLLKRRFPQLTDAAARRAATGWTGNFMDEETVTAWLDAGVRPEDHAAVRCLVTHGVRPAHLGLVIDGQRIRALLRSGATATRVVGLLRAHGHL